MAILRSLVVAMALCVTASALYASEQAETIPLPRPQTEGGKPLMEALKERQSNRTFDTRMLPDQTLSNLLWAAFGVNRPNGKRTAPSAMNWQEVSIYVFTAEGVFLYDAQAHALKTVVKKDLRALAGTQGFVKDAPVNLVYVADHAKMKTRSPVSDENKQMWAAADTGFIAQNVYLFCASEGLNTVVRGLIPRDRLRTRINLRPEQKIILAQTIGYRKP